MGSAKEVVWETDKGKICRVTDAAGTAVRWLEYSNAGVHTFTFNEVYMDKHSSSPRQAILHDKQRNKFVRLSTETNGSGGMEWSSDCLNWQPLAEGKFKSDATAASTTNLFGWMGGIWQSGAMDAVRLVMVLLLFGGIIAGAMRWKGMEESQVLELRAEDFVDVEDLESGATPYFVDFYAPWCSHCRELMPVWEDLAHVANTHVNVAKVDCEAEPKVLHSQGIQAFPTLMLYRPDTEPLAYQGARDLDAMVDWLKRQKVLPKTFKYDKAEYKARADERKRKKEAKKKAAAAAEDEDSD